MRVFIKGLNSCAMRKAELAQYKLFLEANGHKVVAKPEDSDIIILWTCGFRSDVRDNSVDEIKRYQKEYKAELIVAGCLPDIDPQLLGRVFQGRVIKWRQDALRMEEIFAHPNAHFEHIPATLIEGALCADAANYRVENPDKAASFHDQFIKLLISEGCNYKCSYCSERLAFPPYRSISADNLVASLRKILKETDCRRLVLLADSVGDYGSDIGTTLPELMKRLYKVEPALKIALNNLNPDAFIRYYDEITEFIEDGRIEHFNLPIQSASDRILQLMNRPYSRKDIEKIFGMLKHIGFKEFDTHLIVGFPGETENDFRQTVDFVLGYRPKYVLVSGFMESPIMDACHLSGKVDEDIKRKRLEIAQKLINAQGIICNTEHGELSIDRCRRLNKV